MASSLYVLPGTHARHRQFDTANILLEHSENNRATICLDLAVFKKIKKHLEDLRDELLSKAVKPQKSAVELTNPGLPSQILILH